MSIDQRPMNEKNKTRFLVCRFDTLKEKKTMTWDKMVQHEYKACLLVYINDQLYTYANSCPHTGINLNWKPNEFLNTDETYIQCAVHGALFDIENGQCLHGPCLGDSLKPIKSEIIDELIYVYL
ncbi:MAG: Rieske 2Fe-2S domain-containing protein [Pseudomonadota bacterium]